VKSLLALAPIPRSVERRLSDAALAKQGRAQAALGAACERIDSPESAPEPPPMRLAQSTVAEELACLLDTRRPDVAVWSTQVRTALEQEFTWDTQRLQTALEGLRVATSALTLGSPDSHAKALAELDRLLHALCMRPDAGG